MDSKCTICQGEGWVCENHPQEAWNEGNPKCCGGAGQPCACNPEADMPPGFMTLCDVNGIHNVH